MIALTSNDVGTDGIGLATGQTTVDGLLSAMDAAWNQGAD